MTRRRVIAAAAALAATLVVGRFAAGLFVDQRWFAAIGPGALAVWRARVTDLAALRLLLSLAGAAFAFANLWVVTSSVESLVLPRRLGDLEIGEKVPARQLLSSAALLAIALGVAMSFVVDDWMSFDLVQFGRPFGVPEPYTNADLSFFVSWLPFESALYLWGIALLVATGSLVVLLYALTTGLRWERGRLRTTRHVRRHLTALAAALLLVLAWGHRLDAYGLLSAGSGPDGAFVYVDHAIALRARFVLATVTAIASLLVLNAGWQGQGRVAFWVVSGVLLATLVLRGLVPAIGARTVPPERAADRDRPYLRNRAVVTQSAYGVQQIVRGVGYGFASPDSAAVAVPIWDPTVLARAVERARRGELAGDEIGWQSVGGRLGAVIVTRPAPPPDGEPVSWGALVVAGAQADANGDPLLLDTSGTAVAGISLPEVGGRERRLVSFPQATGDAIVSDTSGRLVADPIESFWVRLAHAWNERDFGLLFADGVERMESPAIVRRRDVRGRLGAVAPFFVQGHAVTPLLARDTLFWVCHLYAASATFPLSQRYLVGDKAWGYFQHAAVGVVNGESGAVTLLPDPAPDRITQAWLRRFPTLFSAPNALPRELVAALPPATDGVMLQAWALSQYGSRGRAIGGPVRLAGGDGSDSTLGVAARALALLPHPATGTRAPGFTVPLLDTADRVAGVLVALGGPSPATVWAPVANAGRRWAEVGERLRAAEAAAGGDGREVVRGRVRAVPIAGDVTYVQPLFALRGTGQAASAGVAVLAADGGRDGRTLAEALGVTESGSPVAAGVPTAPRNRDARLRLLYDTMREALRRGDWSGFGAAFDSLGASLGRVPR